MVATWNVRTLQDTGLGPRLRTALIATEIARYNIDIAPLSETRFPEASSILYVGTDNPFFMSSLIKDASCIHGVGFAVKTALFRSNIESPISIDERLMISSLQLSKNRFASYLNVHAQSLDSSNDVNIAFTTPCIPPSKISYCWAILMPGSAVAMTYGKVSLVITLLTA